MKHPAPLSDSRTPAGDLQAEHTRALLIETIEHLPDNPALFRDLLTLVRFLAGRRPRRHLRRNNGEKDVASPCLWVAQVGSWLAWIL